MTGDAMQGRERQGGRRRGPAVILLALLALILGIAVLVALRELGTPPQRAEAQGAAPAVSVRTLRAANIPITIRGRGTVTPKVEVDLRPEVAGRVTFVHAGLRAGGVIRAGDKIVQIDPSDYELAVRQARAVLAEAQARLETQVTQADLARRDLRQSEGEARPDALLLLREPQVRAARAAVESAQTQLALAELQLQRTTFSLPFDVLVVEKKVDLGQYVAAGQPLARAYGLDAFEIAVPLTDRELASLQGFDSLVVSDGDPSDEGLAQAEVKAVFAGHERVWQGRVTGTTGRWDPESQTLSVIVEVPRPFDAAGGDLPLLPGAAVEVAIAGETLENAVAVPREAPRGENEVWLIENDLN